MSDSLVQLQQLQGIQIPAWYTPLNRLYDDAWESFSHGELDWDQTTGWAARLFNDLYTPIFTAPMTTAGIPGGAWVAPGVALQGVARDRGFCKALGVRFPAVSSVRPLGGVLIYDPAGRIIWAATDYFGNLPVLQQDCYVQWSASYGGPFRL